MIKYKEMSRGMFRRAGITDPVNALVIDLSESAYEWRTRPVGSDFEPVLERVLEDGITFTEQREREVSETVREILANSLRACNYDPESKMICRAYAGTKAVVYQISDSGPGFDHAAKIAQVRARTHTPSDAQLLWAIPGDHRNNGNGLLFLDRFATEYHYNRKGNKIEIRFDYADRPQSQISRTSTGEVAYG